jgi:hypothetical protein
MSNSAPKMHEDFKVHPHESEDTVKVAINLSDEFPN